MAHLFKTNVKRSDIEFGAKGETIITSPGLVNTFVHSSPHALEKLQKEIGPVSITKISIDSAGRIVIKDPQFQKAVKAKIGGRPLRAAGDTNYVCNNAYQCIGR